MRLRCALPLAAALLAAGCVTRFYRPAVPHRAPGTPMCLLRPVVAVTEFENQSTFSGQWKLGGGLADLLVTQLLDTERVVVLERKDLEDVVSELARQGRDLFRREGRSDAGRLKNARYLIRGVVTDFTVTGDSSGWFGTKPARIAGGRSTARVTLNVKVSDVESGEVLASTRASGTASSGFFGGQVDYRSVSLGGLSFSRTPLGRATETAMSRAVAHILDALPVQYWQPRVADAADGQVVINGGANVGLRVGARFVAREQGRAVTDPVTGDAIETLPGRERGRLRIVEVRAASARAELVQGAAERGDVLEPSR